MNSFIITIDTLPFSLIEGISISIFECWLIYFILLFFIVCYESRRLKYCIYALSGVILFIAFDLIEDYKNSEKKQIVIYQIKGETNINFIENQQNIFIANTTLTENTSAMLFNVYHHWYDLDLPHPVIYSPTDNFEFQNIIGQSNFYKFGSKTLLLLDEEISNSKIIKVDILYISTAAVLNAKKLINSYQPHFVVLDSKCNWKTIHSFQDSTIKNCKIHELKKEGAFILDF